MKNAGLILIGVLIGYIIVNQKYKAKLAEDREKIRHNLKNFLQSPYAEGLGIDAEKLYKQISDVD